MRLSKADLTLFQNPDDHAFFIKEKIVSAERTGLLPGSGVDSVRYAPQPRGEGPFTFLMAARLLRAKGVEEYLAAARDVRSRHAETRFVLAGSYDQEDTEYANAELLACASRDGIVERHDHVDDIRPLMASADCVVLPSYYREGVPRSLLEAASMGKPLIAADSVGTREPVPGRRERLSLQATGLRGPCKENGSHDCDVSPPARFHGRGVAVLHDPAL